MSSSQDPSVRSYPIRGDSIPVECFDRGHYSLRFATTFQELEAAQRLRFEVFNLELGEGLEGSFDPGPPASTEAVKLPKLFSLYLRYGAKVCGVPALDRIFKTIDYLVLFDREDLDADHRSTFFG